MSEVETYAFQAEIKHQLLLLIINIISSNQKIFIH